MHLSGSFTWTINFVQAFFFSGGPLFLEITRKVRKLKSLLHTCFPNSVNLNLVTVKHSHVLESSRFWQFNHLLSLKIHNKHLDCWIWVSWFGIGNLTNRSVGILPVTIPRKLIPGDWRVIKLNIRQESAVGREPKGVVWVQHLLCWQNSVIKLKQ